MVENTVKFIVMWVLYLFGLTFALILMYASPNDVVHNFEASIFYGAGAVAVLGILFGLSFKSEPDNLMKYLYLLTVVFYIIHGLVITLIYLYANPAGDFSDTKSAYVTSFATILYIASFAMVLLKKGGKNE